MLYGPLKKMIVNHNYTTKESMQHKLDVFFATDRITEAQYTELTELLAANED